MAEVVDWRTESEPALVIARVIETLLSGGVVAVPTAAGYSLVSLANDLGIDRLRSLVGDESLQLVVGGFDHVSLWYAGRTRLMDRFMTRLWPGAVSLSIPLSETQVNSLPKTIRERLLEANRLRLVAFNSVLLQELIEQGIGPLVGVELPAGESFDSRRLQLEWSDSLSFIFDGGEVTSKVLTRVRLDPERWEIERHGEVSEETILRASARWFVFVCTGNTCRSPMAEAIFKTRLAERLQCQVADLPARGYNVLSAGVATYGGDAAAIDAIETASRFGADLSLHQSQPVTDRLVQSADHLIAMTRNHLMTLISRFSPAGTMQLLCGAEGDLDDPIGGGLDVYRECGETIRRHLDRLISEYQLT